MADEPRKRFRFDTPPERRRSRSPDPGENSASHRSRSPLKSGNSPLAPPSKAEALAAAVAAAAKINAQLKESGAHHRSVAAPIIPVPSASAAKTAAATTDKEGLNPEIYELDGDFIKDIEVNDLRNRYTLTKSSTQKQIKEETGADVTTRGEYYPDKAMATAAKPPLYLHITSQSRQGLQNAVAKIEELMAQDLPNLIDERRFRRRDQPEAVERDDRGRRKWPEERIPINLEPIPGFNLRAQVVGTGGCYVKHIQTETGCRVQIKGRGSGYVEHDTGRESDDEMYLHVAGPTQDQLDRARVLSEELLQTVKNNYDQHKERPFHQNGNRGGGSYGDDRGGRGDRYGGDRYGDRRGGDRGGGNGQYGSYGGNAGNGQYGGQYGGGQYGNGEYGNNHDQYGTAAAAPGYDQAAYGPGGYGGAQSPPTNALAPEDIARNQAWAVYYSQHPAEDPYLDKGGYAVVMAPYLGQATGYPTQFEPHGAGPYGFSAPPGTNGGDATHPPGASEYNTVPPPPGAEHYSSVPPPPGL